jgi:pimeloyl-ACP methyl ester carboxylesterase
MPKASKKPADFIVSININGLEGRMLRMPAKQKGQRDILFVYGQHSSLERWFGLAQELNKQGSVTMPDLPGLGGMTSLYKINRSATIDNMAEYLATFVKLKFKNTKITIVAMSLGFVVATRMLQNHPELVKKVDILVSIVGFAHSSDLKFSSTRMFIYKNASRLFSRRLPARIFRYTALQPVALRAIYHRTHNAKEKFIEMSGDEFKRTMDMEIKLWHQNDIRTQFKNYLEMFNLDNTSIRVNLPVYHVAAKQDRYFNNVLVEEHMRRIFSDFKIFYSKASNHAPTVIATAKEAAPFMPPELRRELAKKSKSKL